MSDKAEHLRKLNSDRVKKFREKRKFIYTNSEPDRKRVKIIDEKAMSDENIEQITLSVLSDNFGNKRKCEGAESEVNRKKCKVNDDGIISHKNISINLNIEVSEKNNEENLTLESEFVNEKSSKSEISKKDLKEDLKKWAVNFKVKDIQIDSLLPVLHPYHSDLPITSKTLLKTNLNLKDSIMKFNPDDPSDNSEFVYYGVSNNLQRIVDPTLHTDKKIELIIFFDGLPLFKSSSIEFWPILGLVYEKTINYKPFSIAVHSGVGKPKNVDKYFSDFINEANILIQNGITIQKMFYEVVLKFFLADKPARTYAKCIKPHTGYHACERCTLKGDIFQNRIIYPNVLNEECKRTNTSFRNQKDKDHHVGLSPLMKIPNLDMVKQFPLDFMHLICLGVMKKLLIELWLSGTTKLKKEDSLRMSQKLTNMSSQVTCDFQRTTTSLGEASKLKAAELRFILLYAGPFILKGVLPDDLYKHFMLLHVAFRILCSDTLFLKYSSFAENYLQRFFLLSQVLYGKHVAIFNMHNLIHVTDDVKNLNCNLNDLSAFPFENFLGHMKKNIKCGKKPLTQYCNGLEREICYNPVVTKKIGKVEITSSVKKNEIFIIKSVSFDGSDLKTKNPNNFVLLKNKSIIEISSIYSKSSQLPSDSSKICIKGRELDTIQAAYTYPTNSELFNMYEVKQNEKNKEQEFVLSDVKCKMVLLKVFEFENDEKTEIAVPLLHHS